MDRFNPRDDSKLLKAYEKIIEQMPYDGIHINHQSKIDHIKNIYGNTYKVTQSPSTKSWYVLGKNGEEWIPVTSSFADKAAAEKFMQWLTRAGEMQKKMIGTITGADKRLNEKEVDETQVIGQDTESLPKCPTCGRNHMPDDECPMAEEYDVCPECGKKHKPDECPLAEDEISEWNPYTDKPDPEDPQYRAYLARKKRDKMREKGKKMVHGQK